MDDVAYDDLVDGGLVAAVAVALDLGRRLDHLGQGLGRVRALLVLDKAQDARDQHHDADDDGSGKIALGRRDKNPVGENRDKGDKDQDVGEGIGKGRGHAKGQGLLGRLAHRVGTKELASGVHLVGVKALLTGVELGHELVDICAGHVAQPVLLGGRLVGARLRCGGLYGAHLAKEVAKGHGRPRSPGT